MNTAAPWLLLLPAFVAAAVIALSRRSRLAARLADHPNERSLHVTPTPRVGGLGVLAGAIPVALLQSSSETRVVIACALALAVISALDDVRSLPIEVRLTAHLAAATVALLALAAPAATPAWSGLHVAAGVLAVAWMTNLFNFMDGADGLAGGMAIIGFGAFAIAAGQAHSPALAWTAAAIASACCGLLLFNFPPARVFLGDAGSIPLGFFAGALGVLGIVEGAWPVWFPLLVFSPFIVDATFTVARRALSGRTFWRAHREHLYQRLALAGWPRRRLTLAAYALMAAAATSALLALRQGEEVRCAIILGWLVVYALLVACICRQFPAP